ncbi:MAG: hypothetical protein V4561_06675 [Bacteroidota bacterium]
MNNSQLKDFITYLIEIKKVDSVKDFAKKSDINRQYLYKLQADSKNISIKIKAKIRAAFKEDLNHFNALLPSNKSIKEDILSEPSETYRQCKNCATKDLIIEQLQTTIKALEETLDLYRKSGQTEKPLKKKK